MYALKFKLHYEVKRIKNLSLTVKFRGEAFRKWRDQMRPRGHAPPPSLLWFFSEEIEKENVSKRASACSHRKSPLQDHASGVSLQQLKMDYHWLDNLVWTRVGVSVLDRVHWKQSEEPSRLPTPHCRSPHHRPGTGISNDFSTSHRMVLYFNHYLPTG